MNFRHFVVIMLFVICACAEAHLSHKVGNFANLVPRGRNADSGYEIAISQENHLNTQFLITSSEVRTVEGSLISRYLIQ